MANLESETDLLTTLTTSVLSATSSLPSTIVPPPHGLSLLDTKNELLTSYLHHITFLLLLQSRSIPFASHPSAITSLIKLRLLFERGIKPLESKLKYQLDKAITAATARQPQSRKPTDDEPSSSDSSDSSSEDAPATSDLAFRPNTAALMAAAKIADASSSSNKKDGVYRPPRIAAVTMPEPPAAAAATSRPVRNRMLEDFISNEVSAAPVAEPSIGTTIMGGGRTVKTDRERRVEKERQEYEESNFVRLPKASRKEMAAQRRGQKGARENAFGGEDWRSFAGDLEKITRRAEGAGRGGVLERSRKRGADEDGEMGGRIGERFEGRKKTLKKRRKM